MGAPRGARARLLRRRRAHRLSHYFKQSLEALNRGSSLLLERAVSQKVRDSYRQHVERFQKFFGHTDLENQTDEDVDHGLVRYFEHLFFRGEQATVGLKILAGLMHLFPAFGRMGGRHIPLAWRGLKGWRIMTPGRSRRPETLGLWAGVANALCHMNQMLMGFFVMLSVSTYDRPSSLLALTRAGIIEPGKTRHRCFSLLLHPEELKVPSKTMDFDVSILLDSPYLQWAGPILSSLRQQARDPVWGFDYWTYLKHFRAVATRLNIKIDPYQTRHSGASIDREARWRSLPEVKQRGAWKTDKSVARYDKHARVGHSAQSYPPLLATYFDQCEACLADIFLRGRLVPLPVVSR